MQAQERTVTTSDVSVHNVLAMHIALLELLCVTIPHVQPHVIVTATLPLISRVLRAVVTSVRGLQESNNNTDLYEGKKERLERQGLLPTALPVTNAHKRLLGPAFEG